MSSCPRCGVTFECGMADADAGEPCWCTRLPTLRLSEKRPDKDDTNSKCFCPDCLRALVTKQNAAQQENK